MEIYLSCNVCRPDYYLDMNYIGGKRRMKKAGMEVKKAAIPDDIRVSEIVHCMY